jgi:hypothetical protein
MSLPFCMDCFMGKKVVCQDCLKEKAEREMQIQFANHASNQTKLLSDITPIFDEKYCSSCFNKRGQKGLCNECLGGNKIYEGKIGTVIIPKLETVNVLKEGNIGHVITGKKKIITINDQHSIGQTILLTKQAKF